MNEHVDDLISAYIDQELNENDKDRVERHIQICSQCKGLLDDLTSIQQLVISNYQFLGVTNNLENLIMQRIDEDSTVEERTGYWWRPAFSITSITAVVAVFILLLYFGGIIKTVLHIFIRLISLVPIFIHSIPMLMAGILIFAFLLASLSIWSLRNLLGGGWVEKHIT